MIYLETKIMKLTKQIFITTCAIFLFSCEELTEIETESAQEKTNREIANVQEYIQTGLIPDIIMDQVEKHLWWDAEESFIGDNKNVQDENTYPKVKVEYLEKNNEWPRLITLDFGDDYHSIITRKMDDVTAKGKIVVEKSSSFDKINCRLTVEFNNFEIQKKKITGNITQISYGNTLIKDDNETTSDIEEQHSSWDFNEEINIKLYSSEDYYDEYHRDGSKKWYEGQNTPQDIWDDKFTLWGGGSIKKGDDSRIHVGNTIIIKTSRSLCFPIDGCQKYHIPGNRELNYCVEYSSDKTNGIVIFPDEGMEVDLKTGEILKENLNNENSDITKQ